VLDLIKKYWDIIGGTFAGVGLAVIAEFELTTVQLYYSVIILILVSIGIFRILRQTIQAQRKKAIERKHNVIDAMVDSQKSIKAISLAQEPTKEGEKVGKLFMELWEVSKNIMKKLKTLFDKYKGYLLTILLGLLTAVEQYGGYINALCGGTLVVAGVEVIPIVTLGATIVVGIISNGFTKEQWEKIKALFSKSTTSEMVKEEMKKTFKAKSEQLKQFNKILSTREHELANLNSELETLNNTLQAKREMYTMTPQLATGEDVQLALNAVGECELKIRNKVADVEETKETIENLMTAINALKSQL
jgi:hypothetical protein